MFNFNPREDKFFVMFIDEAKNIHESAILLKKGFENLDNKNEIAKLLGDLEHKGDLMVHDNIIELNNAFITPIDREDIFRIIKKMDNVLDDIDSAANRLIMYDIKEVTEESLEMCDMIIEITSELLKLMEELKKIGKRNSMVEKIREINAIEHKGDKLYRRTITNLFKNTDPIEIIKWKDIYLILENTLDSCEQIAAIVEGVVMKHA
ncbi:DUF47 domain-containing protein [Clostridium thermobutyricum]|uniref:TIGR00153 family protein n=2 Tax=Clostridium thermobutyricum TaxID=29372 RepID=N9Y3G6_9CLOT|nr:DUF47 family protein [Clostridium thermobutyricum]ENZ02372.1 TIGR00153 family protein [Clostridium thermobutyricum]OPX48593.1 putative pit accessory protein [Clostridium thermobutyricum DSM 4928]